MKTIELDLEDGCNVQLIKIADSLSIDITYPDMGVSAIMTKDQAEQLKQFLLDNF
jgi:hypothetical protein